MKNKQHIKNDLTWLIMGLISSLLAHFIIEFTYRNYTFEKVMEFINTRPEMFVYGSMVVFILYILFSALAGNALVGAVVVLPLAWLTGMAAKIKVLHRAEPLYPNDLYWLTEIRFLIEMVGWKVAVVIGMVAAITVISLIVFYKKKIMAKRFHEKNRLKTGLRITGIIVSASLLFYIVRFNYSGNKVKAAYNNHARWMGWSQLANYKHNGFIAGFLYNLDGQPMDRPKHYSQATIQELYEEYSLLAAELNKNKTKDSTDTNVMMIMNESFSDPSQLKGIESNKDPIPHYREIIKKAYSGRLLVPGFGGGTSNAEFQVLTGVSLELLAGHVTTPFIQMLSQMEALPSIVDKMKEYSYDVSAIHAYDPSYYRREDVYKELQFDRFIHQDTMQYTETLNENHPYISDASIYNEMFALMEQTENPDFLHVVTMQNHGVYKGKYEDSEFEVLGTGDKESAQGYFQDLENSDKALYELIQRIDQYPEPILLIFYGDHLPGFYAGDVVKMNAELSLYETPFFVYSNVLALQGETGVLSPIYLNHFILDNLNFKLSAHEAMLAELEKVLPVVDRRMFYDAVQSKTVLSREELSPEARKVLEDYNMLLYDVTTGNNYAKEIGFFETTSK